jgi:hypothetical protein
MINITVIIPWTETNLEASMCELYEPPFRRREAIVLPSLVFETRKILIGIRSTAEVVDCLLHSVSDIRG